MKNLKHKLVNGTTSLNRINKMLFHLFLGTAYTALLHFPEPGAGSFRPQRQGFAGSVARPAVRGHREMKIVQGSFRKFISTRA